MATNSLGIGLVQLVVADAKQAITQAKGLLIQAKRETSPPLPTAAIIELIETIVVYEFPQLSRKEIEQMLGLSELKQTRVYQEAGEVGEALLDFSTVSDLTAWLR